MCPEEDWSSVSDRSGFVYPSGILRELKILVFSILIGLKIELIELLRFVGVRNSVAYSFHMGH